MPFDVSRNSNENASDVLANRNEQRTQSSGEVKEDLQCVETRIAAIRAEIKILKYHLKIIRTANDGAGGHITVGIVGNSFTGRPRPQWRPHHHQYAQQQQQPYQQQQQPPFFSHHRKWCK